MFKFLLVVAVIGAIAYFSPIGQAFKDKTISLINPASDAALYLSHAKKDLASISQTLKDPSISSAQKLSSIQSLVGGATDSVDQATNTVDKVDLGAMIKNIAGNTLPKSLTANFCQN